jgi:hypothetical protein
MVLETPHLAAVERLGRVRIVFRQLVDEDEVVVAVVGDPRRVAAAPWPAVSRDDGS